MIAEFTSSSGYFNTYVICRFHECVIINPSHSYEEIAGYIGPRTIIGLFATEITKYNIDQIGYYKAPLYLSNEQEEELRSDYIKGYETRKYPFDLTRLKILNYSNEEKIKLGENYIEILIVKGIHTPTSVFRYKENLFVGSLFHGNKLAKKANYKSSIYDLKRSIQTIIGLSSDILLYHNTRKPNKLGNEKNTNQDIERWL